MRYLIPAAALALAACAAPPQLSRDEWLAATTRSYPDHTPAEILDAAREVFVLADGDDFTFAYPDEHSMVASRFWMVYMVLYGENGTDVWKVTADDAGTARVNVQRKGPTTNPDLYSLFWDRMDFMLGRRTEWATCTDYDYAGTVLVRGLDALCDELTLKDNAPPDQVSGSPRPGPSSQPTRAPMR